MNRRVQIKTPLHKMLGGADGPKSAQCAVYDPENRRIVACDGFGASIMPLMNSDLGDKPLLIPAAALKAAYKSRKRADLEYDPENNVWIIDDGRSVATFRGEEDSADEVVRAHRRVLSDRHGISAVVSFDAARLIRLVEAVKEKGLTGVAIAWNSAYQSMTIYTIAGERIGVLMPMTPDKEVYDSRTDLGKALAAKKEGAA